MYSKPGGFGRRATQSYGEPGFSSSMAETPAYVHQRDERKADDIDFQILGNDLQFVEIELDPGESVIAESCAMVWKDFDIEPSVHLGDNSDPTRSFGGKLLDAGKRMLSGENMLMAMFTNAGVGLSKKARIAFSSPMPGNIVPLRLSDYGGKIVWQKQAFLAAARGVSVGVQLIPGLRGGGVSSMIRGGITGMLGGEGFLMQTLEGNGWAFVHMGGTVIERQLAAGERIHVDPGCVAAFTEGVDFTVVLAGGGLRNQLLGDEGLVYAALTGPGTVWIQSMPFARLAMNIVHVAGGGSGGGENNVLAGAAVGAVGVVGTGVVAASALSDIAKIGGPDAQATLAAATGIDSDGGILGTLGGWLTT